MAMSEDQQADDRRATDDPRLPIELKVEYKKLNTFFADYTKNICKGGTFIRTTKPLDLGTIFVFRLGVPQLDSAIELRGEVVALAIETELARAAGRAVALGAAVVVVAAAVGAAALEGRAESAVQQRGAEGDDGEASEATERDCCGRGHGGSS